MADDWYGCYGDGRLKEEEKKERTKAEALAKHVQVGDTASSTTFVLIS